MAKGIAHFGILFLLIVYTGQGSAMLVSELLISEVMANPVALPDARGEWFELYNPTDQEINLRDITIGDDDRDRHKIETDLLIMPSEYLTLARSVDPGFVPDYVYNNFTLGNGADEIVFGNGITELLRLDYGAGFVEAGRSSELFRLPMLASNYGPTLTSHTFGPGDIGTPGLAGSAIAGVYTVPLPAMIWLFPSGFLAMLVATILSGRTPAYPLSQIVIPGFKIAIPGTKIVIPRLDRGIHQP